MSKKFLYLSLAIFLIFTINCKLPKNISKNNPDARRSAVTDRKLFFINMDYLDNLVFCKSIGAATYREKEITDFFERSKRMGVDGVLWRVSGMGQSIFPSKIRTPFPGRSDTNKFNAAEREAMRTLAVIDPLKIAVQQARAHGIQIYIWVTISDEHGIRKDDSAWLSSNFILDNPQYALLDRQGKPMLGTLCYSEPAVREHRLDEIKELLSYDPDGIFLCSRTHAFIHNTDTGTVYGFNPVILQEFQKRYGMDLLKVPMDAHTEMRWLELKAEGYTQFMRDASSLVHRAGKKLWIGIKSAPNEEMGWPYGKAIYPWKSWVKKGWVDGVVSGHYFIDSSKYASLTGDFRQIAEPDQTIIFWQQLLNYQEGKLIATGTLEDQIAIIGKTDANGGTYHEAMNLDSRTVNEYWQPLSDAVRKYWHSNKNGKHEVRKRN